MKRPFAVQSQGWIFSVARDSEIGVTCLVAVFSNLFRLPHILLFGSAPRIVSVNVNYEDSRAGVDEKRSRAGDSVLYSELTGNSESADAMFSNPVYNQGQAPNTRKDESEHLVIQNPVYSQINATTESRSANILANPMYASGRLPQSGDEGGPPNEQEYAHIGDKIDTAADQYSTFARSQLEVEQYGKMQRNDGGVTMGLATSRDNSYSTLTATLPQHQTVSQAQHYSRLGGKREKQKSKAQAKKGTGPKSGSGHYASLKK